VWCDQSTLRLPATVRSASPRSAHQGFDALFAFNHWHCPPLLQSPSAKILFFYPFLYGMCKPM